VSKDVKKGFGEIDCSLLYDKCLTPTWHFLPECITLYILTVFNEWQNGILTTNFITLSSTEDALKHVLKALKDKAQVAKPKWEHSSIIVDIALAKLNVLE
jgi:hypothetical protein